MKKFFINSELFIKLCVLTFCVLLLLPFEWLLLWMSVISLCFIAFKKNKVLLNDSLSNSTDIYVAPVTGKVVSIDFKSEKVIYEIEMNSFTNFGLYLPCSAKVECIEKNGKNILIEFINKLNKTTRIIIKDSKFFTRPHIWPKVGDKGRVSANFGFVPFGGIVKVELDKDINQLVTVGDRVFAGSSPLAGIKGN